jgi:hypothetical protein
MNKKMFKKGKLPFKSDDKDLKHSDYRIAGAIPYTVPLNMDL